MSDSETLDEESRMNDAIADLEEKDAIDATGEIYKDKRILNILLIGTDERAENFSENAEAQLYDYVDRQKNGSKPHG